MAHHHPGAGGKGVMNRYALVELPARAIFVIIKEYVRCHLTSRKNTMSITCRRQSYRFPRAHER